MAAKRTTANGPKRKRPVGRIRKARYPRANWKATARRRADAKLSSLSDAPPDLYTTATFSEFRRHITPDDQFAQSVVACGELAEREAARIEAELRTHYDYGPDGNRPLAALPLCGDPTCRWCAGRKVPDYVPFKMPEQEPFDWAIAVSFLITGIVVGGLIILGGVGSELTKVVEFKLQRKVARVFQPLLKPARYKGAWGGRGSGKSHFFGEQMVVNTYSEPGALGVCIREVQRTLKESSKRLIENKIREMGMGEFCDVQTDRIVTRGGGQIIFVGMQDHNADSIKSLEGYKWAWIEEAQNLSSRSLALLRPTIRIEDSEIWASWNPQRKTDAIDDFLRAKDPGNASVVMANWRDNPWFTQELEDERQTDLRLYPDRYDHIWEGAYATALEGAYFAKQLAVCKSENRICRVAKDPILPLRAYWDLGGAGAKADAMAIWICQFVGREIRVLDYCEGQGQVLAYYTDWLRENGYEHIVCRLPHDGMETNSVTGLKIVDHLNEAEFDASVIQNQGRGAAKMRIEAVRRLFPSIVFNEDTTEHGRAALGYYHEKKDDVRGIGLGPEHDWSSHCADAFGLMCVDYEAPTKEEPQGKWRPPGQSQQGRERGRGWMRS